MEKWKDIKGFEGLYQISSEGRVHSLRAGKVLKPKVGRGGYLHITLCKDGEQTQPKIHRLVADAFIIKIPGKPFVNHLNSDPSDNREGNLARCTTSENLLHSYRINGRKNPREGLFGENNPLAKSYELFSPTGERFEVIGLREFCLKNSLCPSVMAKVAAGKRRQHKGWTAKKGISR